MSSFINFKNCGYTTHPEVLTSKPMLTNSNSPLTQQSSLYALTFDELQKTLAGSGKSFGSMNMDELLKNIWTSEETQAMKPNSNYPDLQKQCSLSVPRTFSQKTVDEVWRELLKENGGLKDADLINEPNLQPQEKQPALGEMTLEEFLQKTGVAPEINQTQPNGRLSGDEDSFLFGFRNPNQNPGFHQHQQTIVTESKTEVNNLEVVRPSKSPKPQKILPKHGAFNFTSSLGLGKNSQMVGPMNGVSIIGKIDNPNNLDTSPSSPSCAYGEGGVHKRKMSGGLEKVVERRRKRMIKNRESAARSRARKQAYTLELEAEVAKLKELNHELQKKQEELMGSQKIQVPEKMKLWGNTRLCLRRTLTGPW